MRARWVDFHSPLADGIRAFLAHKRAMGRSFKTEEKALRLLDRYLVDQGKSRLDAITGPLLEMFLASRPRSHPRSYNHLLGVLHRFFAWLVVQGVLEQNPLQARPRRTTSQRRPFLFDTALVGRLLEAASRLPDNARGPQRGTLYPMIFILLYGLGLRVGEVCRLRRADVDLERHLLVIRHTKFSKSRLVPFGPRLTERLTAYLRQCEQTRGPLGADAPVFSFGQNRCVNPGTVSQTFHHLVPHLGLELPPGVSPPRVHDLRHSFAVSTLLHWYRSGLDPSRRLLHLSTFLGHVNPMSTAVYLTITTDLLQQANQRFERFAAPLLTEGDGS
jgi:site-specific recombinase XerD